MSHSASEEVAKTANMILKIVCEGAILASFGLTLYGCHVLFEHFKDEHGAHEYLVFKWIGFVGICGTYVKYHLKDWFPNLSLAKIKELLS